MDVGTWLRGLGLERYEQAFRDNDIGMDLLPALSADDLREIGIASLGHRKQLLAAIATLVGAANAEQPVSVLTPAPTPHAERRQLTVMFVDLVGSTALASKLDPEEMREVIRCYQNAVAGEVVRFEGHVAKFMGDGVLAYFGWPRAHEDEAERAVRAGLALAATVGGLKAPNGEALAARISIATGLVVVGDLVGEGAAQEEAVIGETPNFAARLQGIAAPGQVVIAGATRRLLGAGFELQDLGERELKGIGTPVQAYQVTGERPLESRFEAMSGLSLLPMVGRDQELALLLERWALAKAGEGQAVLLVGEAGIGKSRISRALLDALAKETHFRVRYQCSPYQTDSALWPVVQQLNYAAGLAADDPLEARLDKLEALLDRAGGHGAAPLIADLLGLDGSARYGPLDLTPQAQRARTLEALIEQMLGLAAQQAVLVVVEDAHWIDPTTLELIEQSLDRSAAARVLLLLTSRPDRQPALAAHPHVTRLTLNRLGRAGVEAIVARLGGDRLPGETIDTIIARTDGVPLFVEELTKAVLETGETAIPASLHDSLMARLDRIPEVKEVAQIAACIGREFDYSLLAAIADKPEQALATSLDRLTAAELVFRRGSPPKAHYTFKHALVRDAAHESLLKATRQRLHARLLTALEHADAAPEILAYHATEAGCPEPAVRHWHQAGRDAIQRSAHREAIGHITRGLEVLATLPDSKARQNQELDLRLALGPSLISAKGYAAPEVEANYSRARELAERLGEVAKRFPVLRGLGICHLVRGRAKMALRIYEELLSLAQSEDDSGAYLFGHYSVGNNLLFLGEFEPAHGHLSEVMNHYDPEAHRALALTYNIDVGVGARGFDGLCLWLLGYPDKALAHARDALRLAERQSHPFSLVFAHVWSALLHQVRRDAEGAATHAETGVELAKEHGFPVFAAWSALPQGWALATQGRLADGAERLRQGLSDAMATSSEVFRPCFRAVLAETLGAAGTPEAGLQLLEEELALVDRDVRFYDAELHRLSGELLMLSAPGHDEAESCFFEALGVARTQQAKSLELRAATSLARLWRDQGKRAAAHNLLAPVYAWFTEGFDTPDLKDAKLLLDALN